MHPKERLPARRRVCSVAVSALLLRAAMASLLGATRKSPSPRPHSRRPDRAGISSRYGPSSSHCSPVANATTRRTRSPPPTPPPLRHEDRCTQYSCRREGDRVRVNDRGPYSKNRVLGPPCLPAALRVPRVVQTGHLQRRGLRCRDGRAASALPSRWALAGGLRRPASLQHDVVRLYPEAVVIRTAPQVGADQPFGDRDRRNRSMADWRRSAAAGHGGRGPIDFVL